MTTENLSGIAGSRKTTLALLAILIGFSAAIILKQGSALAILFLAVILALIAITGSIVYWTEFKNRDKERDEGPPKRYYVENILLSALILMSLQGTLG